MKELYMPYREDISVYQEDHRLTSDDKLKIFGYGEWVEEIDFIKFVYCDYECMVLRAVISDIGFDGIDRPFGGHLCGYVKVPEEHILFGKDPNDIPVDVHWCLTFSECHGKDHLIGFDCAHSGDLVPSVYKMKGNTENYIFLPPQGLEKHPWFNPTYKNIKYCIDECCHIVQQLINIQSINTIRNSDDSTS